MRLPSNESATTARAPSPTGHHGNQDTPARFAQPAPNLITQFHRCERKTSTRLRFTRRGRRPCTAAKVQPTHLPVPRGLHASTADPAAGMSPRVVEAAAQDQQINGHISAIMKLYAVMSWPIPRQGYESLDQKNIA